MLSLLLAVGLPGVAQIAVMLPTAVAAERCPGRSRRPCALARMIQHREEADASRKMGALPCAHALGDAVPQTLAALLSALHEAEEPVTGDANLLHPAKRHWRGEGSTSPAERWRWSQLPRHDVRQVCEIGLNQGGSAAMWLCSFPRAAYHSFDLGQ